MKKYLLILLLILIVPIFLLADTFVITSEKINDRGNTYWIITYCKDNKIHTLIQGEPIPLFDLLQELNSKDAKNCPTDFKHESQLQKD